jgi:hypothetical protein
MPKVVRVAERLNQVFGRENIDRFSPELLAPGTTLASAAREFKLAVSDREMAYLSSLPAGEQEALRAALYSALTRSPRLPVTFAWAPGYDYELTVWEVPETKDTEGAMTILVRSPYPKD